MKLDHRIKYQKVIDNCQKRLSISSGICLQIQRETWTLDPLNCFQQKQTHTRGNWSISPKVPPLLYCSTYIVSFTRIYSFYSYLHFISFISFTSSSSSWSTLLGGGENLHRTNEVLDYREESVDCTATHTHTRIFTLVVEVVLAPSGILPQGVSPPCANCPSKAAAICALIRFIVSANWKKINPVSDSFFFSFHFYRTNFKKKKKKPLTRLYIRNREVKKKNMQREYRHPHSYHPREKKRNERRRA